MMKKSGLIRKITVWFLLAVMLPACVLATFLCVYTAKNEMIFQKEEGDTLLNVVAENILSNVEMVENALEVLSLDDGVLKLLEKKNQSAYTRLITQLYDVQVLQGKMELFLFPLDAEIIIFTADEQIPESYWNILHLSHIEDQNAFQLLKQSKRDTLWTGRDYLYPQDTIVGITYNQPMLGCYHKVHSTSQWGMISGVLKCGVPFEKMFSVMDAQELDGHMYVRMNGETIYATAGADILPREIKANSYSSEDGKWYQVKYLESMQMELILQQDRGEIISRALLNSLPQMLIALTSGVLLMVATHSFIRSIQKRLNQAVAFAREAQNGKMEISFPDPERDEIGMLIQSFNDLLHQLQITAEEKIIHEKEKKQALRLALQYQVNPHFLFNTLNWLQMGVEMGMEEEKISTVIVLLGKLLRYNLKGESMAELYEEIECMEHYIQLMNMRQHDVVKLSHDLSGLSSDLQIMRFLLQPLCENAIQHGMRPGTILHIRLMGKMDGSDVVFILENDGKMIPQEQVDQLNRNMKNSKNAQGIGLMNIAARLTLNYGPSASMRLISQEEKTQVIMRFPMKKA